MKKSKKRSLVCFLCLITVAIQFSACTPQKNYSKIDAASVTEQLDEIGISNCEMCVSIIEEGFTEEEIKLLYNDQELGDSERRLYEQLGKQKLYTDLICIPLLPVFEQDGFFQTLPVNKREEVRKIVIAAVLKYMTIAQPGDSPQECFSLIEEQLANDLDDETSAAYACYVQPCQFKIRNTQRTVSILLDKCNLSSTEILQTVSQTLSEIYCNDTADFNKKTAIELLQNELEALRIVQNRLASFLPEEKYECIEPKFVNLILGLEKKVSEM